MTDERISKQEIAAYKREILDAAVLVTIEVAASMLSKSPRTIRRYMEEGKLVPYDHSGRITQGVRLRAADLREYVRSIRVIV